MAPPIPPPPLVDAGLALRGLILRAADAMLPATALVWERSMGLARTQVLATIAELGVPDALDRGPRTAAELAETLDVDADALHRVLRAGAADGIVKLDRRGRFRLTRVGRALRTGSPESSDPWARLLGLRETQAAWGDLTESVRTGRSAFPRVYGMSVWKWFAANPEEERLFAAAMRSVTEIEAPSIAGASVWPDQGVICDVAGGSGTLLAAILRSRPGARGILVEAPGVLPEAGAYLNGQGLADRVELLEGDLFGEISARADVYLLKNILHDWDDATCDKILSAVRSAMAPGARLVVIEQLQERNRPHPMASITDLHMLTQCDEGRERSRAELQALLRDAGLTPGRVERVGISALVEGVAP